MCIGLIVKCVNLNFLQICEKCSNIRYHENLSSGSRVVRYGKWRS